LSSSSIIIIIIIILSSTTTTIVLIVLNQQRAWLGRMGASIVEERTDSGSERSLTILLLLFCHIVVTLMSTRLSKRERERCVVVGKKGLFIANQF